MSTGTLTSAGDQVAVSARDGVLVAVWGTYAGGPLAFRGSVDGGRTFPVPLWGNPGGLGVPVTQTTLAAGQAGYWLLDTRGFTHACAVDVAGLGGAQVAVLPTASPYPGFGSAPPTSRAVPPGAEVNVLDYGADPAAADNTAAVNAAVAAAAAGNRGGAVLFPPGYTFAFTGRLNLDASFNLALRAAAAPTGLGLVAAQATLLYTGSGSATFISARGSQGLTLSGLRIIYNSPTYSGTLVDLSGSGSDTSGALVDRCEVRGLPAAAGAAALLKLQQCISCEVRNTQFSYGVVGVLGQGVPSYSNVIAVRGCSFTKIAAAPVQNGGQMWLIEFCTFEPLASGQAGAYLDTQPAYGPVVFDGCWFGDAVVDGNPWIRYRGNMLVVRDSFVATAGPTTPAILVGGSGAIEGVQVSGCVLGAAINFGTTGSAGISGVLFSGNQLLGGTTLLQDAGNLIGSLTHVGNSSVANKASTPFSFTNAVDLKYVSALPSASAVHLLGQMDGATGADNTALGVVTRGDGGGANKGFEVWTGDGTPVRVFRFRKPWVDSYVPLRPAQVTTAQRDALAAPQEGWLVWNVTTHQPNFYDGTSWKAVALV